MPAYDPQLIAELKKLSDEYVSTFGKLSAEELNWKSNPDVWSVGQVIEHVMQVN